MIRKTLDCPKCDKSLFPSFTLANSGKLVAECSNCQYIDASLSPADFNIGVAAVVDDGAQPQSGWAGKQMVMVETALPVQPRPTVAVAAPVAFTPPPAQAPGDVLSWIENRVMWLASEEARFAGEQETLRCKIAGIATERKQLERMLRTSGRRSSQRPELALVASIGRS